MKKKSRISEQLKNSNTCMKCYWCLIKTLLNWKKVPCVFPIHNNDKYIIDFKEKC